MRTRDELFREAQRRVAARRQRAVTQAQAARGTAFALHPELAAAEDAVRRAGLALAMAAVQDESQTKQAEARAALAAAQQALTDARQRAGYGDAGAAFAPVYTARTARTPAR